MLENRYIIMLMLYIENTTPQVQCSWQHQVYTSISQVLVIWQCPTPLILVPSVLGIRHPMLVVSRLDAYPAHICKTNSYYQSVSCIGYMMWNKIMTYEVERMLQQILRYFPIIS